MVTQQNTEKITRAFNTMFPGEAVNCKTKLANGGFETVSLNAKEIHLPQLHDLVNLAKAVSPTKIKLERSGVGVKILFA